LNDRAGALILVKLESLARVYREISSEKAIHSVEHGTPSFVEIFRPPFWRTK
jgi:hypothetical protein